MSARILVVDDDEDTCRFVGHFLDGLGYDVDLRMDGAAALSAFLEKRHDVVITDVRMPGMDGLEVLRYLRSLDPGVGVIIFSAVVEERARVAIEALRGGAADYISKPIADLEELERAVASAVARREAHSASERRLHELERRARTDSLTGLPNRLEIEQRLAEEFSRLGRSLEGLSLSIFDVDRFKAINDTYGHQAGDRVLAAVADALRENCRAYDLKGRYGGDEFVVVMPETRLEQGLAVAEKIRRAAAALSFVLEGETLGVTLSAGVTATTPFDGVTPEEMIRRADLALYEAKKLGRDRALSWTRGRPPAEVLIVDGNADDAQRLVQMCGALGYRADWTASGSDAVARAELSRYALVLVNVLLPDLPGAEIVGMIRDVAPSTSMALLADPSPDGGRVTEALSRFPVPLARKPVTSDHLRALLSEARMRM